MRVQTCGKRTKRAETVRRESAKKTSENEGETLDEEAIRRKERRLKKKNDQREKTGAARRVEGKKVVR